MHAVTLSLSGHAKLNVRAPNACIRSFAFATTSLFFEIARIARIKKPKVLLLENVKGLVSHNKGRTLDTIIQTLHGIGYTVDFKVLNSKYFGVPQSRERILIVAIQDIPHEPWAISKKRVPRVSSNPSCLPATENAWHGNPPTSKSWSGTDSAATCVMSPAVDSPYIIPYALFACLSSSLAKTHVPPNSFNAVSKPPIPENREAYVKPTINIAPFSSILPSDDVYYR
ncbi:hypothetical protein C4A76_10580 [Brevibacillus laterosporus]|nr:hypothetical protein C4A76_10580 [Brevibacillus laterosporus]